MLLVPVTARLYTKFFNEVIITDKHEKNLYLKLLSFLFVGMMAFGLASCKDDKLIPDIDEPEVNIPIPTEDEVKTTVGKTTQCWVSNLTECPLRDETYDRYALRPHLLSSSCCSCLLYLRNLLHIINLITHLYCFYEHDTVALPKHHSYYTAVIHRNVCVM